MPLWFVTYCKCQFTCVVKRGYCSPVEAMVPGLQDEPDTLKLKDSIYDLFGAPVATVCESIFRILDKLMIPAALLR